MIYIVLNAWPIAAATFAGLVVGWLYLQLSGLSQRSLGFLVTAAIAEGWFCSILAGALILAPARADPWTMATGTAVVIWIGFVVPVTVVNLRARRIGASAVALDCFHWLAVMLVQAFVLKSIGLVAPPV